MRRTIGWWVGVLALATSTAQAGNGAGLNIDLDGHAWERLRGRLALGTAAPSRSDWGGIDADATRINSLSLMGDYYFSRPWLGTSGGLRATSGVLLGARSSIWSSPAAVDRRMAPRAQLDGNVDSTDTLPYLGVGYTGLSSKGGWGLSADFGLMGFRPRSSVRLGTQSLDDTMRDLRFSPLLQVGVSYSF